MRPGCAWARTGRLVPARRLWKCDRHTAVAADGADVRPRAGAASAGVRHVDGRRATADGLPRSARMLASSRPLPHAHAAWRPFCPVDSTASAATRQISAVRSYAQKHGRGAPNPGSIHGLAAPGLRKRGCEIPPVSPPTLPGAPGGAKPRWNEPATRRQARGAKGGFGAVNAA